MQSPIFIVVNGVAGCSEVQPGFKFPGYDFFSTQGYATTIFDHLESIPMQSVSSANALHAPLV